MQAWSIEIGPSLTLIYDDSTVQTDFIGTDWLVSAWELPVAYRLSIGRRRPKTDIPGRLKKA